MMDLNYLVGLEHRYGAHPESGYTDCTLLVSHVLEKHGVKIPDYNWVFDTYKESELSYEKIKEWVMDLADPTDEPQHLDFFMRESPPLVAFGIVVQQVVYFIGSGGRVVCKDLARIKRFGNFFRLKSHFVSS